MLGQLGEWVKGPLQLEVKGVVVERFLNLAMQQDILLSNIVWLSHTRVLVDAPLTAILKLRVLAGQSRCRFRIRHKTGFPFLVRLVKKRKFFSWAPCFFLWLFYCLAI